jgi:hypothetical protein
MAEVDNDKAQRSEDLVKRAKTLMLNRKGLIRDFHAALQYSTVIED